MRRPVFARFVGPPGLKQLDRSHQRLTPPPPAPAPGRISLSRAGPSARRRPLVDEREPPLRVRALCSRPGAGVPAQPAVRLVDVFLEHASGGTERRPVVALDLEHRPRGAVVRCAPLAFPLTVEDLRFRHAEAPLPISTNRTSRLHQHLRGGRGHIDEPDREDCPREQRFFTHTTCPVTLSFCIARATVSLTT